MTGGRVLVLAGPPCAGKSSAGKLLATDLGRSTYLEVDALFSLLRPRSDRNREDRMLAYDAAHVLACLLVERGQTAILECTYARLEQRASLLTAMAELPAAPWQVVEFFVSADDAVQRFRRRQQPTDLDEELLRERVENFPYSDQALRLETSGAAPADLAAQLATWVRHQPGSVEPDRWVQAGRAWE